MMFSNYTNVYHYYVNKLHRAKLEIYYQVERGLIHIYELILFGIYHITEN